MMRLYGRVLPRFRRRRMRMLADLLGLTSSTRVLDVGGSSLNWELLDVRPRVTLLNLTHGDIIGDGTRLPFRDKSFDVVFSNSTIEHVGDLPAQGAFAREVARVGRSYFVQTPNRYFPVEPHYMTPLVHFLPKPALTKVSRNFTVWGLVVRPTPELVQQWSDGIQLLSPASMTRLFPDGEIHRERMLGLTKSLVAVRTD